MSKRPLLYAVSMALMIAGCGGESAQQNLPPSLGPDVPPISEALPLPDPFPAEPFDLNSPALMSGFLLARRDPPPVCIDWCTNEPRFDLLQIQSGSSEALRINRGTGGDSFTDDFFVTDDQRKVAFGTWAGTVGGVFVYDLLTREISSLAAYQGHGPVTLRKLADNRVLIWLHNNRRQERAFVGSLDGSVETSRIRNVIDDTYDNWSAMLSADGSRLVWKEKNQAGDRLIATAAVHAPDNPRILRSFEPELPPIYWRYLLNHVAAGVVTYWELKDTEPRSTYWRMPIDDPAAESRIGFSMPTDHRLGVCRFHHWPGDPERFACRTIRGEYSEGFEHLIVGDVADPQSAQVVTSAETELFYFFEFNPDGRWLTFGEGEYPDNLRISVVALDGGTPVKTQVRSGAWPGWFRPQVSPASGSSPIAFSSDSTRAVVALGKGLVHIDLTTPMAQHLTEIPEGVTVEGIEVLADNQNLLLYMDKRNWIMPLTPGGMLRPLIPDPPAEEWEEGRFIQLP